MKVQTPKRLMFPKGDKMIQHISSQKARSMVTAQGWKMVAWGAEVPSKCGCWMVYAAGYLYKRRACKPIW